ncbi:BgTH12-01695 [Blumeria graminis f. sp. triticale]|uniref:Bgt-501 n=3 Tax=Blumeria graminis TaxID=34373 RepID=A0A061HGU1_BLUGR|nr:hypothetical protein BGT96224_501 [Blumeria graminis f. sp. tritici 96224]CAD6501443.1 BgTH12-01695 [Blumeria graminis f. sp. triticale]VDB83938.1 Bgt-501 [Blumeria graminis f. sp. tritici]
MQFNSFVLFLALSSTVFSAPTGKGLGAVIEGDGEGSIGGANGEGAITGEAAKPFVGTETAKPTIGGEDNEATTEGEEDKVVNVLGESKAAVGGGGAKAFPGAPAKKPTPQSVSVAAKSFANDANTVSNALNQLPGMTDRNSIIAMSKKAYFAELDEDKHRDVLARAAGSDGQVSNGKIMKFTPAVLDGLKEMYTSGTPAKVNQNIPAIQRARNPNILPSITQLSNAALKKMNLPADQQNFPPTGQKGK